MTKEKHPTITKAVIYARVSSTKQMNEHGNGLSSQIVTCRTYAEAQGYIVENIFMDEGVSGGDLDRPGMKQLLSFIKERSMPESPYAIIIDDISRLARSVRVHEDLREAIAATGGVLESPTTQFREGADGKMTELIHATMSQHFREKNAETTRRRMLARWQQGYYTANASIGYRYEDVPGHGKMLVPYEPEAGLVKACFEGYATGRFKSASEIQRYLEQHPDMPRSPSGKIPIQRVLSMLRRPIYAGYMNVKSANIFMHPAKHEAIIDFKTWQRVQDILEDKSKPHVRKDVSRDFVLRGFVCCSGCGNALTSCWSKGTHKAYPYYICQARDCEWKGKSLARDKLETAFEDVVKDLQPAAALFAMAKDMFQKFWDARIEDAEARKGQLKTQMAHLERKITGLAQRLLTTESPSLVCAYEGQIKKLERNKLALVEQTSVGIERQKSFHDMFAAAMTFIANPYKIWEKGSFEHKRLLLRLAFPNRITYDRELGYRTPEKVLLFKAFGGFSDKICEMVPRRRLELPRPCGHCDLNAARLPIPPPGHGVGAAC